LHALMVRNRTGDVRVRCTTEKTVIIQVSVQANAKEMPQEGVFWQRHLVTTLRQQRLLIEAAGGDGLQDAVMDITVHCPRDVAYCQATSRSGMVAVDNLSGRVEAQSLTGDISVQGVTGSFALSAVNGRVRVTAHAITANASCRAVNGDIDIRCKAMQNLRVKLEAVGGRVESAGVRLDREIDLPHMLTGVWNIPEHKLSASTIKGDIRIALWQEDEPRTAPTR